MTLGWLFIAIAIIFIFSIIFLIIWAFSENGCPIAVRNIILDDSAHRELARAEFDNDDIVERVLRDRRNSILRASPKTNKAITDVCRIDLELYTQMLRATRDNETDKVSELRSKWREKINSYADKVSKETGIDKDVILTEFNKRLDRCLSDADITFRGREIKLENPIVSFNNVDNITIKTDTTNVIQNDTPIQDDNMITF